MNELVKDRTIKGVAGGGNKFEKIHTKEEKNEENVVKNEGENTDNSKIEALRKRIVELKSERVMRRISEASES